MGGESATSVFARLEPPASLTRREALAEADRCLMCWDAPCTRACPTSIDVPGFIKRIATGDDMGSARTILSSNILGSSCARVCPTEVLCEGACVLNDLHTRPIQIGRLQGYSTDPVVLGGVQIFAKGEPSGHSVAVVGAGPAGLSCAAELVQYGHDVVVLDAAESPGGLNTHGVADYKLRRETALAEVAWIEELGVEIRQGVTVGTDVAVDVLLDEYDALFLGVGLGDIMPVGIPGEDLPGSEDALQFIAHLKAKSRQEMSLEGQRVAVIGGGNTAVDAATQSARLGAEKVYLIYRRGREEMRAYDHEVELARSDGVEVIFWTAPVAISGTDSVTGLACRRTEVVDSQVTLLDGTDSHLEVSRVFRATGQEKRRDFLEEIPGVETDDGGRVVLDEDFRTGNERIWAGGDCANGGKEVVNAVAHGKQAARSINASLRGEAASTGR
jgi:dihydropyrimidine dehydrogenase (NAD+) subunit PreT